MIDEKLFKKLTIFVALGILLVLTIYLLWPIASAIITGLLLSYVFYPVYKKIFKWVKEKNISAIIVILLVVFLIFIPLWFLLPILIKQIFDIYLYLQKIDTFSLLQKVFPNLAGSGISKDFATSLNSFITNIASKILSSASNVFLNLPVVVLKLLVVIFVFFFGMRDAEIFKKYAAAISPFSKSTEKQIVEKFKNITNSVIYGYFVVGILQGIMAGLGLFLAGVPQALVLTIIAIFASIIPILGAWLVWIPAVVYLLVSGKIITGIILFLYGALIISWIDNVLRVYIVTKKTKISSLIVLLGEIGGFIVFGILGLLIGPLILVYLLLIIEAYKNKRIPSLFS